jgi:8-oxo-dGTP pyrophosphatase MutT (NUDIX family)
MSDNSTQQKEWVDWMNVKLLQKAVILDEENNILLLKKDSSRLGERAGHWDIVGGKMEPSDLETKRHPHLEALKREINEETGLVADTLTPFVVRSGVKISPSAGKVLIYFVIFRTHIRGIKPTVTLSKEHVEYKWIQKKEAMEQDFGNDGGEYKEILGEI